MLKYFWSLKSFIFISCLMIMLGFSSILAHYSYVSRSSCEIEFILQTPSPLDFGIYYDIGEGLSQKYHQQKRVETTDAKTSVSFCIASYRRLHTIRFDPAMEPIAMDIFSITLRYSDGSIFKVPFESLQAGDQIKNSTWDDTKFSFSTTPNANDPTFVLTQLNNGTANENTSNKILHYIQWIIGGLLITMLGRFFILYYCLGV